MRIHTYPTTPFPDQKPGTSGLRKKVSVFEQPRYLENFAQAIFDCMPQFKTGALVLSGDGRYFCRQAIRTIIKIAAGNGARHIILGADGIMSTPAAADLIVSYHAAGGILLTASHNPGGRDGDFGVKINGQNGGAVPQAVMDAIYARAQELTRYHMADPILPDDETLAQAGLYSLNGCLLEVAHTFRLYAGTQQRLFDFPAIGRFLQDHRLVFDAMHGVTGPYAQEIFCNRLGVPEADICHSDPKQDFGGQAPDPHLAHLRAFYDKMAATGAEPALVAASDGDGDRNLMMGPDAYITPSDLLALLVANAKFIPCYGARPRGVARSMPTSSAVDRVAKRLDIPCYKTPTGWKFFAELIEAQHISLCGEESAGIGGDHILEKDGLWAILCLLNIMAARNMSVAELLQEHWHRYGRTFYRRHDYHGLERRAAKRIMNQLKRRFGQDGQAKLGAYRIIKAGPFHYQSPVDGARYNNQGIEVILNKRARLAFRLSGTTSDAAILRVYLEKYTGQEKFFDADPDEFLADLAALSDEMAGIHRHSGRDQPDIIT